jgi:hypothetical protein
VQAVVIDGQDRMFLVGHSYALTWVSRLGWTFFLLRLIPKGGGNSQSDRCDG